MGAKPYVGQRRAHDSRWRAKKEGTLRIQEQLEVHDQGPNFITTIIDQGGKIHVYLQETPRVVTAHCRAGRNVRGAGLCLHLPLIAQQAFCLLLQ